MKKSVRVLAAVLFAVVLLLCAFSALVAAHHHHTGEDCRVCAIAAALRMAKAILFAAVCFFAVSAKTVLYKAQNRALAPAKRLVRLLN